MDIFYRNRTAANGDDIVRLQVGNGLQILDEATTADTVNWSQITDSAAITVPTGVYDLQFVAIAPVGDGSGNFLDDISLTLTPILEFDLASYEEVEGVAVNRPQLVVNGQIPAGGITVPVTIVAGGTTVSPSEFSLVTNVTIPAGQFDGGTGSVFPIDITINDDIEIEATETIEVSVGPGVGYEIAPVSCAGAPQATAIYTILDNDARLTLDKTIVNDNGGTQTDDTAFTLEFDGGTDGAGSGSEGDTAVTTSAVTVGTFALSESGGPTGYELQTLNCVGAVDTTTTVANPEVDIVQGELVTCSFTNNDIAPRLTITKLF